MTALAWLIPAALSLGLMGLAAFLWSLKSGQYDDLDGAGWRALDDEPVVVDGRANEKTQSALMSDVHR